MHIYAYKIRIYFPIFMKNKFPTKIWLGAIMQKVKNKSLQNNKKEKILYI